MEYWLGKKNSEFIKKRDENALELRNMLEKDFNRKESKLFINLGLIFLKPLSVNEKKEEIRVVVNNHINKVYKTKPEKNLPFVNDIVDLMMSDLRKASKEFDMKYLKSIMIKSDDLQIIMGKSIVKESIDGTNKFSNTKSILKKSLQNEGVNICNNQLEQLFVCFKPDFIKVMNTYIKSVVNAKISKKIKQSTFIEILDKDEDLQKMVFESIMFGKNQIKESIEIYFIGKGLELKPYEVDVLLRAESDIKKVKETVISFGKKRQKILSEHVAKLKGKGISVISRSESGIIREKSRDNYRKSKIKQLKNKKSKEKDKDLYNKLSEFKNRKKEQKVKFYPGTKFNECLRGEIPFHLRPTESDIQADRVM